MLKTIFAALLASAAREQGQALIMGVGVILIGFGAVMISLDIGWWIRDKGDLQNDADAIALAAAGELPDENAALLSGEDVAISNEIDPNIVVYTFEDRNGDTDSDTVRVRLARKSNSFLAKAFGVPDPELKVTAVAGDLTANGACLKPWAIRADPLNPNGPFGLEEGTRYVLKDKPKNEPGRMGAISWYGRDEDTYRRSIQFDCLDPEFKVTDWACATGEPPIIREGDALGECHGDNDAAKHAILALDDRYDDPGDCDADNADEAAELAATSQCADRAVTIAITNALPEEDSPCQGGNQGQGSGGPCVNPTIHGIATFYIADWDDDCGDDDDDCVRGYLLPHTPALPQWVVSWSSPENPSSNPLTPISIALVE